MSKSFKLLVKFKPDTISGVKEGKVYFRESDVNINNSRLIFNFNYSLAIPDLGKDGNIRSAENTIDFSQYKGMVYVETDMTYEQLVALADEYNKLSIVEYTVLEPTDPIQPPHNEVNCPSPHNESYFLPDESDPYISVFSTTPDFISTQLYLRDNPATDVYGINADYTWYLPTTIAGQGIRCADVEWGMDYQHEDLVGSNFIELIATTDHTYDDHGTAVAGAIMARNNRFGMLGGAYTIDAFYGISEITYGRVAAIAKGLEYLRAGDVFLFEMQDVEQNGNGVPPDYNKAVWDITKTATDAGIIVVMAAGNGAQNLDDAFYNEYRNRGDNGAIRVGAGTMVGRNRASFSTYGSTMVHVQGWGGSVATTGYGTLWNGGVHRTYCNYFSGTSSASPIVAAATILIQSWYKAHNAGKTLSPRSMRKLLIETGTAQGTGGHIGPLPNVKRAIEALAVPNTYPLWEPNKAFVAGDRVSWNGSNWQAQWWSVGVQPGTPEPGSGAYPWQLLRTASSSSVNQLKEITPLIENM